jgi:ATP-dependent DNA helicase RecQ
VWWALLREAFAGYREENGSRGVRPLVTPSSDGGGGGGGELPVEHFLEWLAEWGRELRRAQRGLLLLTAHRAKGLEFDHVVVLDGDWDKVGRNEDRDAPRRLYYVAMTRARETLTLARLERGSRMLDALRGEPSVLERAPVELAAPPPELARLHERLSLEDVDIGFAGRQHAGDAVHARIAKLEVGDALTLREHAKKGSDPSVSYELLDIRGARVGKLAKAFALPKGMRCIEARVNAVVVWKREWTDQKYAEAVRCEQWEVVVPELVFAPE